MEAPDLPASPRIEGPNIARRVLSVRQAVADAVAKNDEVLVDDRRRRVRVARRVDGPPQPLRQIDDAVCAKRRDRRAGRGVETHELRAAVQEDAESRAV